MSDHSHPPVSNENHDRELRAARYFNICALALNMIYEASLENDGAMESLRHFADEMNDRAAVWSLNAAR